MKVQIGRWGNSFAVRLPRALMERLGLQEGDEIDLAPLEEAEAAARRESFEKRREQALERIRQARWPLPPDYKFDRDDANWRPAVDRW